MVKGVWRGGRVWSAEQPSHSKVLECSVGELGLPKGRKEGVRIF